MPHIALPEGVPGILAGITFRPETGGPLCDFAEALLRGPSSLTAGEREIIATFVSGRNECDFCRTSHRAIAAHQLDQDYELVDAVCSDYSSAPVAPKLKALLGIAAKVQKSGKAVTPEDVAAARTAGASDYDIHDTVLIAAAFCMFNRYVDGLGSFTPVDQGFYDEVGARIAREGYSAVIPRPANAVAAAGQGQ